MYSVDEICFVIEIHLIFLIVVYESLTDIQLFDNLYHVMSQAFRVFYNVTTLLEEFNHFILRDLKIIPFSHLTCRTRNRDIDSRSLQGFTVVTI